jgi:7-cyano-7-deazaguanine synthase
MAKDLAIVLNSGSINSAVLTALAAQRHRPILLHALKGAIQDDPDGMPSRARVAFDQQAAHFKPYREHTLAMPFLSLLKSPAPKQIAAAPDLRQQGPLGPIVLELLPLLAAAARFASHYQASAIYLGLRVGTGVDELAQATEYMQVWTDLLQMPCGLPDVELSAPLLELEPWQVVDLGFQVNAPLDRTWSCANDGGEPCWACRGCRSREAAFQQSGKPDPIRAIKK